jgi:hypothetical protein
MPKDELSEEHQALLREAEELGVDTIGYSAPNAKLDNLRGAIARQTERLARQAAAQERLERAASEAEAEKEEELELGAFDEVMGQTRGVLIRVTEWTEWLPVTKSEHLSALTLANGVTGFEAGENERLSIRLVPTGSRRSMCMKARWFTCCTPSRLRWPRM